MIDTYKFYKYKVVLVIKNLFNKIYTNRNKEIIKVINHNRNFLNSVPLFINSEIYKKNIYGIPPNIYKHLNKKVDNTITYSDLLAFFSLILFEKKINYLETGVSVLKNFLQMDSYLQHSNLYSYEIEKINPLFSHIFDESDDRFKVHKSNNSLYYFEGDLMKKEDNLYFNEKIKDVKFDIVFSDAHHQHWSLIWEYKNIIKPNLKNNFLIYFDDADFPDMTRAIKEIKEDLEEEFNEIFSVSFFINGWIGQYEKMHKNVIISTFNIEEIIKKEKIKLFNLRKL